MMKLAVFGSGNGSNFQAIAEYFKDKKVEVFCVSDKKDAHILKRAEKLGITSFYVPFERTDGFLKDRQFDLIALAGYMRILPQEVLNLGNFINIHPSFLPEYKGLNAIARALEAKEEFTGVTIHKVSADVDSGLIIIQEKLPIYPYESLQSLETRIHKVEHSLYPKVIEEILLTKAVL